MKISVALCTYNGQKHLVEQLNSIINQTKKVDEIIICDDLSTDDTIKIIENFISKNPQLIHLHINEVNLRSNKNFEQALQLTTGDYIFFADQDDIWQQNKVEKMLNFFNENPTAQGVFSNAEMIDENGTKLIQEYSLWSSVNFFVELFPKPIDLFNILITKGNYVTGATLCIKKEVKAFCIPFKVLEKDFLHDEWLAFVLSKRKTLFYINENLISYRIHANQQMGVGNVERNFNMMNTFKHQVSLMFNHQETKRFKDLKFITKNYKRQYLKFKKLHEVFQDENFGILEDQMKSKFAHYRLKLKKSNPLLYALRELKFSITGKNKF
jgi:glycosyltransferase involved in cell wall biosynthesis